MIELGDNISLNKRKDVQNIAREFSIDLNFASTVEVVIKVRQFLAPTKED
jgi:hypothetical protein